MFETPAKGRKVTLEPWVGGRYFVENADGSSALHMIITYIEPGRLLRATGAMGLSHLPATNAFIFELQPKGKGTLFRFCQRTTGYMTADIAKGYKGGWKQLFARLKALAEKKR
jgi:uncharacterized protein YndB with AHSA1/START domain